MNNNNPFAKVNETPKTISLALVKLIDPCRNGLGVYRRLFGSRRIRVTEGNIRKYLDSCTRMKMRTEVWNTKESAFAQACCDIARLAERLLPQASREQRAMLWRSCGKETFVQNVLDVYRANRI